jgi:hypothetical protein
MPGCYEDVKTGRGGKKSVIDNRANKNLALARKADSNPSLENGYLILIEKNLPPPASAKLPNPKPNARWRDGFSLVPSISVGCADKRKVGALVQTGILLLIMDFVFDAHFIGCLAYQS